MAGEAAGAPEMLPGLVHFAVLQYCGEEAAWEEMAAASPAGEGSKRRGAVVELPRRG